MSNSQHSFLNFLESMGKPDIDNAQLLLEHAKDINLSHRQIEGLTTFIDRQREAAKDKARAKKSEDAATGAWANVKEAAKKRDDLVSQAEDASRTSTYEEDPEAIIRKIGSLLEETCPTAVEYYTGELEGDLRDSYLTALPLTTNEKKPCLRSLFEGAIEIIKHDIVDEETNERMNAVIEDYLARCEAASVGARTTLVEACQRKKMTARQILQAIAPVELDILEGNEAPDGKDVSVDELVFAHACWKHWDNSLTSPAIGSAIVKAIETKKAETPAADSNGTQAVIEEIAAPNTDTNTNGSTNGAKAKAASKKAEPVHA
jgi:hypothetical protein